jgi:hypothetical protein
MRKQSTRTPWIGLCSVAAFALAAAPGPTAAQSAGDAPTYSADIAPIVQDVCMRCHVEGGLGPMALTNYQEVRRYATRIRGAVLERSMPPWHMDPTIGIQAFNNDISLTREQVETVVAWVDAGAPEGDPSELPSPPADRWTWGDGWELEGVLGEPDMVVNSGPIPIPAEGQDVWPDVRLPWPELDETRYLRAAEIRNTVMGRRALHHNNIRLALEGRPSGRMVGAGASKTYDLFADDSGVRLDPGPGELAWGLHYALYGEAFVDTVQVALWFYPKEEPPLYESTVEYHHLIDQYTEGEPRGRDILIPPHGTQTLTRVVVLDEPIMINSIRPHMHLHGVGQSVEVIWPVRQRDYLGHTASPGEMLSAVNNYDHNWQTSYSYQRQARPLLPKGAALMFRTHFDNTANNPLAIDPDQWVAFGARSVDGMSHMHTAISYLTEEQYETLLEERVQLAQEQLNKPQEERLEVFVPLEGRALLDQQPPVLD